MTTPESSIRAPGVAPTSGRGRCLLDRYDVGPRLGVGAMAEVHAGYDRKLRREVAIKLLRDGSGPEARHRFESEARAAAGLLHPNVVAVFDVGEDAGEPFIVMERLPGTTLADQISTGPLSIASVRRLAAEVLAGLAAAHSVGIVHRDIKPGNVLRADDGTWKVADFGIAKSLDDGLDLTTQGVIVCTPAYVAPERLSGAPATPASDCYSAGVLLYYALSGVRPFDADDPLVVADLMRTTRPRPLHELRPDADRVLVGVVERAMDIDPRRRYADASAMYRALRAGGSARDAPTVSVEPTRTAVLPRPTAGPSPSPPRTDQSRGRGRPTVSPAVSRVGWLVAVAVLAAAAVVAGFVVVDQVGNTAGSGSTSTTVAPKVIGSDPSSDGLPSDLDRALRRLEQAVQP